MLARLRTPQGTRQAGGRGAPAQPEQIGSMHLVDVFRFYRIPEPASAAFRFLNRHVPAGTTAEGTGSASTGNAVTERFVAYALKTTPAGVDDDLLIASVVPGPRGGTLMRVDAEVSWYPARSAAEYIWPHHYRSVRVTGTLLNPTTGKTRTVSRVLGSRVVSRLARLLNGLHRVGSAPISCPYALPDFRLTFRPRSRRWPLVQVQPFGCTGDQILVGARAQPVLEDIGSFAVFRAIRPLLGFRQGYW